MLGIARHHVKQPEQRPTLFYFVSPDSVSYNTGTYGSVEFGFTGLTGGAGDVQPLTLNYYSQGGNTSHAFRGFSLPAGTWLIDFSYYASMTAYETRSPVDPPGGMNNFTIRRGDPVLPPNFNYTPIWDSNSSIIWSSNAGQGGNAEWECYNTFTNYWRTRQPIQILNSLNGNTTSTQPQVLTETTNFWITMTMLQTKIYTASPALLTVSRLD